MAQENIQRSKVREMLRGPPLRVLYARVTLKLHGHRLAELVAGARDDLLRLGAPGPGTRVLLLIGVVREPGRRPLWWRLRHRRRLMARGCCHLLDDLGPLCTDPELAAAVDVALTLGMPLLLTGEPGSGKSGLADSLAWELGLGEPLRFPVQSDTESRDLFYRFDTVGRFHAAQTRAPAESPAADAGRFISFEALGRAILLAKPVAIEAALGLPPGSLGHPGAPCRSVVLIDEIDKAPRDVPNDILVEIERMEFGVPELRVGDGQPVRVALGADENRYRPIVKAGPPPVAGPDPGLPAGPGYVLHLRPDFVFAEAKVKT